MAKVTPHGLQGLEIDGREQPRLVRIAPVRRRVGDDGFEIADALALGRGKCLGRIVFLAERTDGREFGGEIEDTVGAHGDHGRTVHLRQPDAADQRPLRSILGEKVFNGQCRHGKRSSLFLGSAAFAAADPIGEDQ